MDIQGWIFTAGLLIALGISVYTWSKTQEPLTPEDLRVIVSDTLETGDKISDIGLMVVAATEQLKERGDIQTNDEAYQRAFSHLESWFPDFDPRKLEDILEGSYRIYKDWKAKQSSTSSIVDKPSIPL